jgi:predicted nucleotidyltransferase
LRELVGRILTAARPDRIILFGSAPTGAMTRDSDIDLLVVEPTPLTSTGASFMKPPEVARRELVAQWVEKADRDYDAAEHLHTAGDRLRSEGPPRPASS